MQFEEKFTVGRPIDVAWQFFEDPDRLALCVPGVESVEPLEDGRSMVRMTQKVGPLSATFNLYKHDSDREEGRRLEVTSVGKSIRGAVGELRAVHGIALTPAGDSTDVDIRAEIAVGGMLGSVGSKAMASKAKKVAQAFAVNVSEKLESWEGEPA